MKYIPILLAVILCGCGKEEITLSTGEKVHCAWTRDSCGISMYECDDGTERYCQTNVLIKRLP